MEYRRIHADELAASSRIMAQAFHFTNYQDPNNDTGDKHEFLYGAFDEKNVMRCTMSVPSRRVNYHGQFAPMATVGGVASLPEVRRGGNMRGLITFMLQDVKARGDKLSALYPFSHEFYRKFGYEVCARKRHIFLLMDALKNMPDHGHAEQFFPGMDDSVLHAIYQKWIANCNLTFEDAGAQQKKWDKNPYTDRHYVYIWYDDDGVAKAYVHYNREELKGENIYKIQELCYTCREGLFGMLGFLKRLSAQSRGFSWDMPDPLDPLLMFPEPYILQNEMNEWVFGMARLIDIPWCLENKPWPHTQDTLTIRVTGDVLSENNGVYQVTLGEKAVCEKVPDDTPADMEASIQVLSMLCIGTQNAETLLDIHPDLKINRKQELIFASFPRKNVHMNVFF